LSTLDYDQIMPIVKSVATSVSSKFPPYVRSDDTEGALLLWTYQNKSTLEGMMEDGGAYIPKIASMMRKAAFSHCAAEKAASEGYDPSDIYRYSAPKIKSLIADAMDYENWQSFNSFGDGQPKAATQTYNERTTELVDIKNAMSKLNDDSYNILVYQFKYELTSEEIGTILGMTAEAVRKRSQRAVKALQKELGYKDAQPAPQAGRRPVRSNAAWRADLSTSYEG